tara:strand:- start:414 stop:614 length:201 start_codon:yes stop_codon:yes gene_type:complete
MAIFLSLLGSIFTSLSFILMKYAHNRLQKGQESTTIQAVKDPYWAFGFFSIILGSVFNVIALKFGS